MPCVIEKSSCYEDESPMCVSGWLCYSRSFFFARLLPFVVFTATLLVIASPAVTHTTDCQPVALTKHDDVLNGADLFSDK